MEQKLDKSGWNLNPMYYWQFVKGYENRLPCILVKGNLSDGLRSFLVHYPQINVIVEDGEQVQELKNVLYRERVRLTDKDWLKGLTTVDYLVCDEENIEYWLPSALCGVKIIFNDSDWVGESIHVRSYLERIDSWEWARKLLT